MIDIHSHILPETDDGAKNPAESLTMAEMAVKDGITTVIATPHITGTTTNRKLIQEKVTKLQQALTSANIPLQVTAGGEIPFYFDGLISEFTLCNSNYILLELPHEHVPTSAAQKIYDLKIQGYSVILAHPERNGDILRNPQLLEELLDCGALIQITAGSITGEFGPQPQHCAHHLLRHRMVHFLATDCHSSVRRKPLLQKATTITGKIIGKKEARKLVYDNPQQIITGTS